MGNKGNKPRSDAKPSVVKQRKKPISGEGGGGEGEAGGGGGGETDGKANQCWTFILVDIQPTAKTAKKGAKVRGAQSGSRVMVLEAGVLGFAPDRESEEMLTALRETRKSLTGEVLFADTTGANIGVELCLS